MFIDIFAVNDYYPMENNLGIGSDELHPDEQGSFETTLINDVQYPLISYNIIDG